MGETLTDEWYGRISGEDAVPDLYLGRLPAESVNEAQVMVSKIMTYEMAVNSKTWEKDIVLVADNPTEAYEYVFESVNNNAAALLPTSMHDPFYGYLDDYLIPGDLTADIKAQINKGALIVNYGGHGSTQVWAGEQIFDNADVAELTNSGKYPFIVSMSCLAGHFGYDGFASLAETLLRAEDRGAVAALMPTGMSEPAGQKILNTALFEAIFTHDIRQLGPAIAFAKQTLLANGGEAFEKISETFLLFGDPALRLKVPLPHKPTGVEVQRTDAGIAISWQAATDCNGNPVAGYYVYRSTSPGGNYIKINAELITETEFLDTDPGSVGASSGGGAGTYYYGVTSVDDSGDESARTLGSSPAAIGSSSGAGAGGAGCFINTTAQSQPLQGIWIWVIGFVSLIVFFGIQARRTAPRTKCSSIRRRRTLL